MNPLPRMLKIKSIYQKVDSLIGGKYGNYLIVNNNVAKELNLI